MVVTATTGEKSVLETLRQVADEATAGRVFGAPVERDGVVVLPAAKISSGGGGGSGTAPAPDGQENGGNGGGFGIAAKPTGAFVIADGRVTWRPAIDVNRIILGGQAVVIVGLLVVGAVLRARARRSR